MIIPLYTTKQREELQAVKGMIVFDTDLQIPIIYNGEVYGAIDPLIMAIMANGKISMKSLPTSDTGLSAGDLYVSSAATILANGDLVVGYKQ